jgi:hypothetical protein
MRGPETSEAIHRVCGVAVIRADQTKSETNAATCCRMSAPVQRDSLSPQRGEGRGEG